MAGTRGTSSPGWRAAGGTNKVTPTSAVRAVLSSVTKRSMPDGMSAEPPNSPNVGGEKRSWSFSSFNVASYREERRVTEAECTRDGALALEGDWHHAWPHVWRHHDRPDNDTGGNT